MAGPAPLRRSPLREDAELADLLAGLASTPPRLSPRYFYDDAGSRLFEAICELPEYYPTRTELAIMERHAADMARHFGRGALLIEAGAGSGAKARQLVSHMASPAAYVPVDISPGILRTAEEGMRRQCPDVPVISVCADFTGAIRLPPLPPGRRIVYFSGSTIGNFEREEAVVLLRTLRDLMGPTGGLLIGVDLVKARDVLRRAYNDSAGVTARFNLNALTHINRRFDADFVPAAFAHEAIWDEAASRIEMRLVSRSDQAVTVAGRRLTLAAGEHIVTEYSHKYTVPGFAALARRAGLELRSAWTDDADWFSVQYYE